MHPPLFRPHPQCSDYVDMLVKCHQENTFGKFIGACNDIKAQMDHCFKAEKEEKRRANMQRSKEVEERFQRKLAELQAKRVDSPISRP